MWIYDEITCAPTGSDGKCRGNTVTWPTLTAFTENVVRSMSAAGVERWFFFSTNPAPDPWASVPNATYLANERNELTPIGVAWLQATAVAVDAKWASRLTHTETSAGSAPAANPVLETGL